MRIATSSGEKAVRLAFDVNFANAGSFVNEAKSVDEENYEVGSNSGGAVSCEVVANSALANRKVSSRSPETSSVGMVELVPTYSSFRYLNGKVIGFTEYF